MDYDYTSMGNFLGEDIVSDGFESELAQKLKECKTEEERQEVYAQYVGVFSKIFGIWFVLLLLVVIVMAIFSL